MKKTFLKEIPHPGDKIGLCRGLLPADGGILMNPAKNTLLRQTASIEVQDVGMHCLGWTEHA
jgi:hypothetical protein